jgi:glyoxylase-like metal-dependent hydrolase (beta-lactamase superfamily II)
LNEISPTTTSLHVDLKWFPQPYPPNVFLVRDGNDAALIDSGFGDDDSYDRRIEFLHGLDSSVRVKYIILTHHHYDHSSGAHRMRDATGAQVVVHTDEKPLLLDTTIETGDMEIPEDQKEARAQAQKWREEAAKAVPDILVNDGHVFDVGGLHLRCIHTPGHTAGHLCILLEEERLLFAGDNVLGVGTSAIGPPPHGDMGGYVTSLRKMQTFDAKLLAPGHGPLVTEPNRKIQELIEHREQREAQIVSLVADGRTDVKSLLKAIYPELDKRLKMMATGQILSHLHKLQSEGKLRLEGKGADTTIVT